MNDLSNISKRIEDTLSSLDGIEKKQADPFFYTRLSQRLYESREIPGIVRWFSFSPVAKPAFIAALFVINLFSLWHYLNYNQESADEAMATSGYIQIIACDTTYTASNEMYLIFNEDE